MKDMEKIIEDSYYKAPSGYDGLANDKKFFSDTATALHQAGYRKMPTKEELKKVVYEQYGGSHTDQEDKDRNNLITAISQLMEGK